MQAKPDSKYALQDMYEEIDLFDRKIAHCRTHEKFDLEPERESALGKLMTKREALVKAALAMVSRGVECSPKYLPRSLKQPTATTMAKAGS